jgi:hypothetical protein
MVIIPLEELITKKYVPDKTVSVFIDIETDCSSVAVFTVRPAMSIKDAVPISSCPKDTFNDVPNGFTTTNPVVFN